MRKANHIKKASHIKITNNIKRANNIKKIKRQHFAILLCLIGLAFICHTILSTSMRYQASVSGQATGIAKENRSSTYSVVFNANNGTGTMANQTIPYATSTNLNANTLTRTGYTFNGWNTQADGSGTAYVNQATMNVTDILENNTLNLYAQWKENNYQDIGNNTYYATLKEAVENAPSGSTIKVLRATNETITPDISGTKEFVFDLNGNNVTLAQNINLINRGILTIQGTGTLTSTIQNMNGGTLVIAGASITSSGTKTTISNFSGSTVRMTCGSISSTNRNAIEMTSGEVTITGGTVEGARYGIYNNSGTITIGDETQIGDSTIAIVKGNTRSGVLVGSGTLNFNGGKIQTESSTDEAIDGTATVPEGYDVLVTTLGTTKQAIVSPTYTLILDPKGGTIPTTSGWTISTNGDNYQSASKIVTYGATYGELPTPTRTGYTFGGWYSATDLNDTTIAASTTDNNNHKIVEYNIKPGVTYTLTIGNAELAEGTDTQFTALI